jgi:amino acid transporter
VAMLGHRSIKIVLYLGWIFAIIGIVLTWGYLATTTPATFAARWDSILSNQATYNGIIQTAAKSGWTFTPFSFSATLVAVPLAVLFLLGGNFVNAVSGEVKNAKRTVPMALFLSLVLGIIFWWISSTLTLNATDPKWMSAIGYLYDNNATAYNSAVSYPPSMPMFLSILAYPNQLILFLIAAAYVLGSLPTLFFYFWIPSRYFFAWSFDRILPSKISDVNERFRSPHWAIAIITVISIIILYLINFTSYPQAGAINVLIWFSSFIPPSVALALLPYLKKDLFASAPSFFQRRLVGIPIFSIIGIVCAASFSYMVYVAFQNPLLASVTALGVEVEAGLIVSALVIYYASVVYHRRRGLDITLAFKEIPPE